MTKQILIIIIGILLLAVDIPVAIGEPYPAMVEALDLGQELQGKIITNFIGTQPMFDVLPDILGYVLLFIGSILLLKKDIRFIFAALLVPLAIYYEITLPQLPYNLVARELYLKVAGTTFLKSAVEIGIEFFVIHGIVKMTNCMENKWHNNELLAAWIIAMMAKGLLVGINFFFGRGPIFIVYSIAVIIATIVYINRLTVVLKYKPEGKA